MHPIKTEDKYLEFEKLSRILQIPVPLAYIGVEVKDKDGNITECYQDRSHSWNRNFYSRLYCYVCYMDETDKTIFGAGHLNSKNVIEEIIDIREKYPALELLADAGDSSLGILIGTGDTAEDFEGYELAAKIDAGTGAGQMSYEASPTGVPTYTPETKTWDTVFERFFNNNSGGSIIVTEAALTSEVNVYSGNGYTMLSRDILSSAVTVAEAGQLKITYTISMAFPA